VLIDVHPFGLTGRQASRPLRTPASSPNRNAIRRTERRVVHLRHPHRTPALTSRGLGTPEMGPDRRPHPTRFSPTSPAEGSKAKYNLDPAWPTA